MKELPRSLVPASLTYWSAFAVLGVSGVLGFLVSPAVPSHFTQQLAWLSIPVALLVSAAYWTICYSFKEVRTTWLSDLFDATWLSLLFTFFVYVSVLQALPFYASFLAGDRGVRTESVVKVTTIGRRFGCPRLVIERLHLFLGKGLCTTVDYVPPGTRVRLHGLHTRFGTVVENYDLLLPRAT